jgi:1-acyl-sn-glycerol-3-phosphate acyltransferase
MKWLQTKRRAPGYHPFKVVFWWTWVRFGLLVGTKLLYRIRLHGVEHVPERGPAIYAINHQSHYDPMLLGLLVHDRPFASMARASLFSFRPFGWLISTLNAVPLQRGRGDTRAIRALLAELAAGRTVLVFPEGARTRDGGLGHFHPGVMTLVRRSGAPVVPAAVEGAFDIWPRSRRLPRFRGRLAVRAGPAIPADELTAEGVDPLDRMRRAIETMRLELRAELRARTGDRYPPAGPGDEPYWEEESD